MNTDNMTPDEFLAYAQEENAKARRAMEEFKIRQIEMDAVMQAFSIQMQLASFNMLSLFYASLNPNLTSDDLIRIFGK